MEPKILYQDESIFVVDKPAGWITNSASTTTGQPVVEKWLADNFHFPIFNYQDLRHGIVHRLDKETSGLLVIAKTKKAFEKLQSEFKNREVQKKYVALCHGKVDPDGEVKAQIGRLPWRRDRFGVLPGGRESATEYKLLRFYPGERGGYSLVEFSPKTGRTHQIRVHAKHIGHAIVADEFYAGRKTARNDRLFCPRLFLHAAYIKFIHPVTDKKVEFKSTLPTDLQEVLDNFSRTH